MRRPMLRNVLMLMCVAALGTGAVCLLLGADPPGFMLMIWVIVIWGAAYFNRNVN